ncbi:MAG: hypothetical protein KR126chlam3_00625 [Chlamydiae bacterium]|nr:hypothetical protein [Chlamydiota bacterium]
MQATSRTPLLSEYDQDNFSCWENFKRYERNELRIPDYFCHVLLRDIVVSSGAVGVTSFAWLLRFLNDDEPCDQSDRSLGLGFAWFGFSFSILCAGGQLIGLYKHHCGLSKSETRCYGKFFLLFSVATAVANVAAIIYISNEC